MPKKGKAPEVLKSAVKAFEELAEEQSSEKQPSQDSRCSIPGEEKASGTLKIPNPKEETGPVTQFVLMHVSDEYEMGVKVFAQSSNYEDVKSAFASYWAEVDLGEQGVKEKKFIKEQLACMTFPTLKERHSARVMQVKNKRNIEGCWVIGDRKSWYLIEKITISAEMVEQIKVIEANAGMPGGGFIRPDPQFQAPPIHGFELLSLMKLLEHFEWDFVRVVGQSPIKAEDFSEVEAESLSPLSFEVKGALKNPDAIKHFCTVKFEGHRASLVSPKDSLKLAVGLSRAIQHMSKRVNAQERHIQAQDEHIRKLQVALQEEREGKVLVKPTEKDIQLVQRSKDWKN